MLETKIKNTVRTIPNFPKEGIQFKDITPLLLDAELSTEITKSFADYARDLGVEIICGIESRGFIFGAAMAQAAGLPFVLIRKKGKLPGETIAYSYDLEYGSATIEVHHSDIPKNSLVLIHDDLLATGGTAVAAAELVKKSGGQILGFSFIVELAFLNGSERLKNYSQNIQSLVVY